MTYREDCQRIFFFLTVFSTVLSSLDYSLTFMGFPLVSGAIHNCLPGNYLQMSVLSALQKGIATPKNSERFEIGCARSDLGRSLNTGIHTAFISRLYCSLFFIVLGFVFPSTCGSTTSFQAAILRTNTLEYLVSLMANE